MNATEFEDMEAILMCDTYILSASATVDSDKTRTEALNAIYDDLLSFKNKKIMDSETHYTLATYVSDVENSKSFKRRCISACDFAMGVSVFLFSVGKGKFR